MPRVWESRASAQSATWIDQSEPLYKLSTISGAERTYHAKLKSLLNEANLFMEDAGKRGCKLGSDSLVDIQEEHEWLEAKEAGVSVCIYSFGRLDLAESNFFCDFGVKVVWQQPRGEARRLPTYDIPNAFSIPEEVIKERENVLELSADRILHNSFKRYQCEIREVFSVSEFPFDSHLLHVKVRLLESGWKMIPLDYHELKIDCKQPDWHVYKPIRMYGNDDTKKPQLVFAIVIRRKWGYYVWNVITMQGMLTSLAFSSFAVAPSQESWDTRASITLSLIISTIALKWSVSSSLPKVNYFTFLDTYMYFAFVMKVAIMLAQGLPLFLRSHLVALDFFSDEAHTRLDGQLFYIVGSIWLGFNASMFLYAAWCVFQWHWAFWPKHWDFIAFH